MDNKETSFPETTQRSDSFVGQSLAATLPVTGSRRRRWGILAVLILSYFIDGKPHDQNRNCESKLTR